jgi:hypothetical protein
LIGGAALSAFLQLDAHDFDRLSPGIDVGMHLPGAFAGRALAVSQGEETLSYL